MIYFKYFDQEGYVVRQDLFLEISCTDKLLMREIGAVHILDIYTYIVVVISDPLYTEYSYLTEARHNIYAVM